MNRTINRLKLFFIGVFVLAVIAVWGYQIYWVQPKERCEAGGAWWSNELRRCETPVSIREYKGLKPPPPFESLKETLPRKGAPPPAPAKKG